MQYEHLQSSLKRSSELRQGLDPRAEANPRLERFKVLCCGAMSCLALIRCEAADPLDQWVRRGASVTQNGLYGITYGGNQFVAVGDGTIVTSPDGTTWTKRGSATNSPVSVAYGDNTFIAVGGSTDQHGGVILTSPDGVVWASRVSGTTSELRGIAYGNHLFVAVGDLGAIVTSPDGIVWTVRTSGTTANLLGIAYGNNQFMAIGIDWDASEFPVVSSVDGINWINHHSNVDAWAFRIAYGNDRFVTVCGAGGVYSSQNGDDWTRLYPDTDAQLYGVSYGNETFVAVGQHGAITASPDGTTWGWTRCTNAAASEDNLLNVAYGNGRFVAVGDNGTIIQSASFTAEGPKFGPVSWSSHSGGWSGDATNYTLYDFSNCLFTSILMPRGYKNQHVTIEASADLVNWAVDTNLFGTAFGTAGAGNLLLIGAVTTYDLNGKSNTYGDANLDRRFFRARVP